MKIFNVLLFLLCIVNSTFSQSKLKMDVGASIRPVVYFLPSVYADEYSISPNLEISIGDDQNRAILSIGNYSRIGAQILSKWFYCTATYNLSLLNTEKKPKHGCAIEVGFNYNINSMCNTHRIQIGAALSVLGKFDANYAEVMVNPITVSFMTEINFKPKLMRSKHNLALN